MIRSNHIMIRLFIVFNLKERLSLKDGQSFLFSFLNLFSDIEHIAVILFILVVQLSFMSLISYEFFCIFVSCFFLQEFFLYQNLWSIKMISPAVFRQDKRGNRNISRLLHLRHLIGNSINFRISILPKFLDLCRSFISKPRWPSETAYIASRLQKSFPFFQTSFETNIIDRTF